MYVYVIFYIFDENYISLIESLTVHIIFYISLTNLNPEKTLYSSHSANSTQFPIVKTPY